MEITQSKLKIARMMLGINQLQSSRILGFSEAKLSKIETGRTPETDDMVRKLIKNSDVKFTDIEKLAVKMDIVRAKTSK